MMADDAQTACGRRYVRGPNRQAHRWGKTKGKIGFHGGMIEIERPRLRGFDSKERALPSWEAALAEDWLGKPTFLHRGTGQGNIWPGYGPYCLLRHPADR